MFSDTSKFAHGRNIMTKDWDLNFPHAGQLNPCSSFGLLPISIGGNTSTPIHCLLQLFYTHPPLLEVQTFSQNFLSQKHSIISDPTQLDKQIKKSTLNANWMSTLFIYCFFSSTLGLLVSSITATLCFALVQSAMSFPRQGKSQLSREWDTSGGLRMLSIILRHQWGFWWLHAYLLWNRVFGRTVHIYGCQQK